MVSGDGGDGRGAGLLFHVGGKELLGNEKAAKVLTLTGRNVEGMERKKEKCNWEAVDKLLEGVDKLLNN